MDVDGARKARDVVAGRTFNGNLVRAEYYPEGLFIKKVSNIVRYVSVCVENLQSDRHHTIPSFES